MNVGQLITYYLVIRDLKNYFKLQLKSPFLEKIYTQYTLMNHYIMTTLTMEHVACLE